MLSLVRRHHHFHLPEILENACLDWVKHQRRFLEVFRISKSASDSRKKRVFQAFFLPADSVAAFR